MELNYITFCIVAMEPYMDLFFTQGIVILSSESQYPGLGIHLVI
jgi:hypothetical protein